MFTVKVYILRSLSKNGEAAYEISQKFGGKPVLIVHGTE